MLLQDCTVASITSTSIVCYLPPGGLAGNSTPIVTVHGSGTAAVLNATAIQQVHNDLVISRVQPQKASLAGGLITLAGRQ